MGDAELVTVGVYQYPDEAKLARALLEAEGIAVFLENEHTLAANWMWTNLMGGLRIRVAASSAETARQLLEAQVNDAELAAQAEAAACEGRAGEAEDDEGA